VISAPGDWHGDMNIRTICDIEFAIRQKMACHAASYGRWWHIAITAVCCSMCWRPAVGGDLAVAFYGGVSWTLESTVRLQRNGGHQTAFQGVKWQSRPLQAPPYYGFQLIYWPQDDEPWGVAFELTHAKMYADLDAPVRVTGKTEAPEAETPLRETFDDLSFSHGHNLLTVNVLYRSNAGKLDTSESYVGIGAGLAYPHVEVTLDGVTTDEFQVAGWAYQLIAGAYSHSGGDTPLFAEYKFSHAVIDAALVDGSRVRLSPVTNHLDVGIASAR